MGLREGTFFLKGGGGGAWGLRGEGASECQKRGGSYLFVRYPGGGIHTFPRIFLMRIFVRLLSIFLTDYVFLYTYFDLIWCFIIGSRLHFFMDIMPWHTVFSEDSCPFPSVSSRIRFRYRFFSFLPLLTIRCLVS